MKKLIAVLLLLIIGESAYAEYVTILPVNSQTVASASSEIITLSELYGKSTTIRYMTDSPSQEFVALNNTNIYPSDSLTLTEDVYSFMILKRISQLRNSIFLSFS